MENELYFYVGAFLIILTFEYSRVFQFSVITFNSFIQLMFYWDKIYDTLKNVLKIIQSIIPSITFIVIVTF